MPARIDGVLESVGAFGKYQFLQVTLSSLGAFTAASHFLIVVFHSITPDFRCTLPGWEDNDSYAIQDGLHNFSVQQWIPLDKEGRMLTCNISSSLNSTDTEICSQWVFDKSSYWGTTLNMNFGLLCANSGLETVVKVVFTTGAAVGAVVVGIIADRFGRRISLIGCMIVGGGVSGVSMFSPNIIMYAVTRFICAMCFVGVALIAHVIAMEIVGPSRRTRAIAYRTIFWPSGTMFTSLLAYYFQDWDWMQLSVSVLPLLLGIIFICTLNETPHYLLTHNRHDEAEKLFKAMARMNGRQLPEGAMESLKEDEEEALTEKVKDIFKAPVLLKRTAIFIYLWFIAGLGFYGLNFNINNLAGNTYINNVISGCAELPQFIIILISSKLGRKSLTVSALFLGAVALLSAAFMSAYLDDQYDWALITVSMIGKFSVTVVFTFDYFWSSEVFPTTLRSTLVGICSLWARIGMILSPIIVDLYKDVQTLFAEGLGTLIFGSTMLIGGFLALYLPETNNKKMPETIYEANIFMTDKQETEKDDEKLGADSNNDDLDFSSKKDLVESTEL